MAERDGRKDLNRLSVTLELSKHGRAFDLTPEGLRAALWAACGDDPSDYCARKDRALRDLGYEDGHVESQVRFWIRDAEHFSDIMLGQQPIRPERIEAYDIRFGVRLPYSGDLVDDLAEIWLSPPSLGACTVSVRPRGLAPAAVFQAEAVMTPVEGEEALLVSHPDFTVKLALGAGSFISTGDFETKRRSLTAWVQYARALSYLASGEATIVLTMASRPDLPLNLPSLGSFSGPYLDQMPALERLAAGWGRLLDFAGLSPSSPYSLQDTWDARAASLAVELSSGCTDRVWMAFDREEIDSADDVVEAVYVNTAALAGAALTYAVKVRLAVNPNRPEEYRSTAFELLDVCSPTPDHQAYAEMIAARYDLVIVINPVNLLDLTPAEEVLRLEAEAAR